jgi:hypothetical protein
LSDSAPVDPLPLLTMPPALTVVDPTVVVPSSVPDSVIGTVEATVLSCRNFAPAPTEMPAVELIDPVPVSASVPAETLVAPV